MKPKPIRVRTKDANGIRREFVLENIVYLSIEDLHRELSSKPVFVIDLDTKWKEQYDTFGSKNK